MPLRSLGGMKGLEMIGPSALVLVVIPNVGVGVTTKDEV